LADFLLTQKRDGDVVIVVSAGDSGLQFTQRPETAPA
jgi:hypothetical protein